MAFLTQAVIFVLAVVLCIHHSNAQSVQDRCRCPAPSLRPFRRNNIQEFSVTPPRSRCKVEIIVTLKTVNKMTKEKEQCVSPDIHQGKQLQECWNRVNKDGRKSISYSECESSRNTTTATKILNTTTVSQH